MRCLLGSFRVDTDDAEEDAGGQRVRRSRRER